MTSGAALLRRGAAPLVLATVVLTGVGATAFAEDANQPGAGGQGAITWGVQPSSPDGPNLRPYFNYVLQPGSELTDYVGVTNFSDKPLTLSVYASDAFNNAAGGFDLLAANIPPADAGTWVSFKKNVVNIPAKTRLDIPFTVRVPADASPGDHVAGIIASYTVPGGGGEQSVTVDQRVASRLYTRVMGPVEASLAVENVEVTYQRSSIFVGPGSAKVKFTLRNTGNVRLSGTQALKVSSMIGTSASPSIDAFPEQIPELLPGNSVSFEVPIDGVWPFFSMTATETVDPVVMSGGPDETPAISQAVGSVSFFAVPWVETAVLLIVIVVIVLLILRRSRKRKAKANPPAAPSPNEKVSVS
jgi:hypothetical protein